MIKLNFTLPTLFTKLTAYFYQIYNINNVMCFIKLYFGCIILESIQKHYFMTCVSFMV